MPPHLPFLSVVDSFATLQGGGARCAPPAAPPWQAHCRAAGGCGPALQGGRQPTSWQCWPALVGNAALHEYQHPPELSPSAVQVQAQVPEPSVGAQDSCSMDAAQEQEEQESPAADEAPASSPGPAAKPIEAAGAGAAAPAAHPSRSPGSSSKAPRSSDAVAAADAVTAAVAAAAPTLPFDSEPQLDVSQLLATMPPPSAAAPKPQVGAGGFFVRDTCIH